MGSNKISVLIAEDEHTNYLFLEEVLSEYNCKIFRANNGEEAISLCKENTDIKLIFMDIKMPKVDGYEATKIIKTFRPDIKVIAQTAYALKTDREKALSSGCDEYISKPIELSKLTVLLEKYLT